MVSEEGIARLVWHGIVEFVQPKQYASRPL